MNELGILLLLSLLAFVTGYTWIVTSAVVHNGPIALWALALPITVIYALRHARRLLVPLLLMLLGLPMIHLFLSD